MRGVLEPRTDEAKRVADRIGLSVRADARTMPVDPFGLVGILLAIGIWQVATYFVPAVDLPPPGAVAHRISVDFFGAKELAAYGVGAGGLLENLEYTAENVVLAVVLGAILGILIGLLSARLEWFRAVIDPIVLIVGTVPVLVALPFFLIWFGPTRTAAVVLVTIYTMFILIVFSQRAAENLSTAYEDSAKTLGATEDRILRDIIVPGTLPEILGGIRIAFAGAWGLAAISELLGLPRGLGKVVQVLATQSDAEGILAAIMLLGLLAVVMDALIAFGIRSLFRWRAV